MAGKDGYRTQQLCKLNPRVHCSLGLSVSVQCFIPYYTARNFLIENRIKDYSLMLNYLQTSAEKASAFCNVALQMTRSGCIQMSYFTLE